ncbi:MAG: orotidine-5'-phosphate decarboxylase [Thiomonas sp.]|uniref:orotidine-5'-phosphate decarboxylase n=1 Tax=Thiomonas sp. TaxID=2047785 RepID=UPI002A366B73|nr:orotidine-5'-phosphate decarboxylase [Thiomonas sp.]MDY0329358.1 orotidine-5'-phosphate decarboxylase [Thiomonas sp.]
MTSRNPFTFQWQEAAERNNSALCVGLDPEPSRFPAPWTHDPLRLYDFCAAIVDATADLVCAYKPQIAYFAALGAEGQLERLVAHIRKTAPGVPVILDAKRGDIGATAQQYAREAFERFDADALTVSPYMGLDSIEPYLAYPERGLFVLCRTSNPGGADLQTLPIAHTAATSHLGDELLFERVARLAALDWNRHGQNGLVAGATNPADIERIRAVAPQAPLLIPGIGAQGGDLAATVRAARGHFLINASRSVLYASSGRDFVDAARREARRLRDAINQEAHAAARAHSAP